MLSTQPSKSTPTSRTAVSAASREVLKTLIFLLTLNLSSLHPVRVSSLSDMKLFDPTHRLTPLRRPLQAVCGPGLILEDMAKTREDGVLMQLRRRSRQKPWRRVSKRSRLTFVYLGTAPKSGSWVSRSLAILTRQIERLIGSLNCK